MKKTMFLLLTLFVLFPISIQAMTVREFKKQETRILESRLDEKLDDCRMSGQSLKSRQSCVDNAKIWHKKRMASLERDAEAYYVIHYASKQQSRASQKPPVIYTQNGRPLYRAAGGYTDNNGTFYSDSAGGITNSRNGQFIPNSNLHQ